MCRWLPLAPKPCMNFWSYTIWPLTVRKNGTSSWTPAWVRAGFRRALALHMYNKCHVAPSHRRFAHPSWIAGIKLMLDLLLGARKHRYLRSRPFDHLPAKVSVRGFSAGSYSGICLLHLLWNMPHVQVDGILGGIALPPLLLHGIQPDHGDRLMVIHLTTDRLCQCDPRDETLSSLPCKYCIVDRSTIELREHFGEHSYGHWIDLNMPHGRFPLWQLLRQYPEVAHPQCRDIAPLRLVSWVSCEVPAPTGADDSIWGGCPCFFK